MKKTLLIILSSIIAVSASGWGKLGHATIAEIAERHLTPKAKANIDKYTGGVPLASFASWMDEVRDDAPYNVLLSGYHASICNADCESPLYLRKFRRNCADGVSAIELFKVCLKDYRDMPDSMVLVCIKAMTHIVGDIHCPSHVRYTDEVNELKYHVMFYGKDVKLHAVFDSGIIQHASGLNGKQYSEYADRLDTWNKKQINAATKGRARQWFEDGARDIRPIIRTTPAGAELGEEFVNERIDLCELEIRKAGYQLAKLLNKIFK